MAKYLDENGLLYLWSKIKAAIPTKTSSLTNDSGFITGADIPEGAAASTTTPKMNGTAAVGSEKAFARGDHVHPSDTSKLGTSGNGSNVTVAFTAASARANIATGEKLSVIAGKLAKWFSDLKTVAFTGAYSDLTGAPTAVSAFTNDSGYQTAAQVQNAISTSISTVYKYKGSVAAASNLPTSGNAVGDVYNVTATGMNYVWTGSAWDALGSELNVEAITNAEIDTIVAS